MKTLWFFCVDFIGWLVDWSDESKIQIRVKMGRIHYTGWFWEILGGPFSKTYLAILNVINAETDDELEFWIVGNLEELNSFSREGNIGRIYLFPALL